MPRKILELCLSPEYGGLELHMRDFSRWLAGKTGVDLLLGLQQDTRLSRSLQDIGAPTLLFPSRTTILSIGQALRLAGFIEKHRVEVVHVHWKFDLPLVALAKKISRRKFRFVHTRQMNMPGKKRDPYHRFIYGQMDCFIAITQYLENQARRNLPIAPERITRIYYGVEAPPPVAVERISALKRELNISGDFTVGLLGRISEYKGQHLLIEAVEKLRLQGIVVQAWLVGAAFEPAYLEKLKQMVAKKQLTDQIHFMDFYEPAGELMRCFDTVVLTTRNETFGLVLIEAMHGGVAVIGSDAGGVPEIIDHGETGLLFETWNSAALAEAVKQLYQDPVRRERLARAGQQKARRLFDRGTQYQKVLDACRHRS